MEQCCLTQNLWIACEKQVLLMLMMVLYVDRHKTCEILLKASSGDVNAGDDALYRMLW